MQAERGQGEVASSIQCYMNDHPEISKEEALKHVYFIMENSLDELNWEFVNNKEVPESYKRLVFEMVLHFHGLWKLRSTSRTASSNRLPKLNYSCERLLKVLFSIIIT